MQKNTRELVDLPPSFKPLNSKWVLNRKRKVDRLIEKHKDKTCDQRLQKNMKA